MDFIIYYIEIGLITNAIIFALEFFIALYLTLNLGYIELTKFTAIAEENKNKQNYWSILHFLIPFFSVYILFYELVLIHKHYNRTADSLETIFTELDKYKIFKRKRN